MVIRIKIVTGYVLLMANLALLAWLWVRFGDAGLGIYAGAGAIQLGIWASQPKDTPEKKKRRETAFVRADGQIFCNGKRISLKDARKRGLKLEYEDEPKPRKQPNFWTGR
jgi:hypothetical protein